MNRPGQQITVPEDLSVPLDSMKVWKVVFERFNLTGDSGGHPAPDPILLTVRAAYVFSQRHRNKATAASPGADDIDDDWSYGDDAAMEQYIEVQQKVLRPPDNWNDFAQAMGQSGAARPRDWSESKENGNRPVSLCFCEIIRYSKASNPPWTRQRRQNLLSIPSLE